MPSDKQDCLQTCPWTCKRGDMQSKAEQGLTTRAQKKGCPKDMCSIGAAVGQSRSSR